MTCSTRFRRRLLASLAHTIGIGACSGAVLACGGEAVIDPPLGTGGSTSQASSSSAGMMCTETTTTGGGQQRYSRCVVGACPADESAAEPVIRTALETECCTDPLFECEELLTVECGPFETSSGDCCFEITTRTEICAVPGRPLRVEGTIHRAAARERDDWQQSSAAPELNLPAATRAELAARWKEEALLEHASVASFSRFALSLLAVGAPPALVEEAHLAALDEVRHAEDAFALASAYAGRPLGPGALALPERLAVEQDLPRLAVETLHEACVNETVAAVLAEERRARAADPAVVAVLGRVVDDESRHAELGWRFLAWALKTGGEPVRSALQSASANIGLDPSEAEGRAPARLHTADQARHGQIDAASARRATRLALDEVVRPCLRALLSA